jgi:hypothetical protein
MDWGSLPVPIASRLGLGVPAEGRDVRRAGSRVRGPHRHRLAIRKRDRRASGRAPPLRFAGWPGTPRRHGKGKPESQKVANRAHASSDAHDTLFNPVNPAAVAPLGGRHRLDRPARAVPPDACPFTSWPTMAARRGDPAARRHHAHGWSRCAAFSATLIEIKVAGPFLICRLCRCLYLALIRDGRRCGLECGPGWLVLPGGVRRSAGVPMRR